MTFETDTLRLLTQAAARGVAPRVRALHLPPARPADTLAGESCALELDDGSIGLSYVLFGGTLEALRVARAELAGADLLRLARGYTKSPAAQHGVPRTLGFAAVNALTASLFRRCGWRPPDAVDSIAAIDPQPGEHIGMVGYFAPLVPQILARGATLVVIELRDELLGDRPEVRITADPTALADCDKVLATGTLLLNGTLQAMLDAAPRARRFALVGPSAGGLPDALFARGVTDLGGSWIEDGPAFVDALRSGARRGPAARKFALPVADYPGLPALLSRL